MNFITIKTVFKLGFVTLFGFSFMLLTVPVLVPLLLISWLVSQAAFLCIKVKYGNSVEKPSGMDIVNGKENDISKPYIYIVCRFTQRNPDIDSFRKRFQTVVLDQRDEKGKQIFGKFTKIFERLWGYYVWRNCENFDLRNHIRMIDTREFLTKYMEKNKQDTKGQESIDHEKNLPADLSDFSWENLLNFLITEMIASKPIPSEMPKWEFLFLPETENRYTTVFRLHHSISDGIYLVRLIAECLADVPFDVKLPYKIQKVNFIQRVIQNAMAFSLLPYGLYKALTCNDRNPLHGPNLKGKKKFLLADPFELSLLQEIKQVAKVTVNDIIFSCVSYAASKHFERRKSSIEEMTVLLAVTLQRENKPLRLKNNFAVTGLRVPTSSTGFLKNFSQNKRCTILRDKSSCRDLAKLPALSRLQIVKHSLDEAKNDPTLMSLCWLLQTLSFLLPASIAEFLLSTKGITMDVSNIQGPQTSDFILNSALAEDVTFWLPDRDPLGIGISIISYNGVMRTGIIVDEALIAEDEEGYAFLNNFREEVLNIHREIMLVQPTVEKTETEFSSFLPKDIP